MGEEGTESDTYKPLLILLKRILLPFETWDTRAQGQEAEVLTTLSKWEIIGRSRVKALSYIKRRIRTSMGRQVGQKVACISASLCTSIF